MADQTNTEKKTPFDKRPQMGVTTIAEGPDEHRNEKVGKVISTKMEKTIAAKVEMGGAHPKYKRGIKSNKNFYAHDEAVVAHMGHVLRIREPRPLSKLKRWQLKD